jgi:hypothetical protein
MSAESGSHLPITQKEQERFSWLAKTLVGRQPGWRVDPCIIRVHSETPLGPVREPLLIRSSKSSLTVSLHGAREAYDTDTLPGIDVREYDSTSFTPFKMITLYKSPHPRVVYEEGLRGKAWYEYTPGTIYAPPTYKIQNLSQEVPTSDHRVTVVQQEGLQTFENFTQIMEQAYEQRQQRKAEKREARRPRVLFTRATAAVRRKLSL